MKTEKKHVAAHKKPAEKKQTTEPVKPVENTHFLTAFDKKAKHR